MKKLAAILSSSALIMAFSTSANATPTLQLISGGTTVTVADGSALDRSIDAGIVTYINKIGNFNVNVTTGESSESFSSAIFPLLELISIDITSITTAGTLALKWSDTGFTIPPAELIFDIGGTKLAAGSITYEAYYDSANTLFGTSGLIGKGTASTTNFSDEISSGLVSASGPFSLTEIITLTGVKGTTSFNASITDPPAPVPEPGTILLLGAGLVGLGLFGRRRRSI